MRKDVVLSRIGIFILASIYLILAGCSSSGGGSSDVRLSGVVSDPFISAARVWCDVNDNGYFDDGDKSTLSGIDGSYKFSGNDCATATLIVDGLADTIHVDADGNLINSFTGRMKAPAGAAFISPLTSLQQTIIESDTSDDDAATKALKASATVAKALGLVDAAGEALVIDFTQTDINAADQKGPQKAAIVAQQLLLDTTSAMQGTSGAPTTPSSFEAVTKALANAIANATQPLIDKDGGLDPVIVKQAVRSTVEAVVMSVPDYADFDAASIMSAIGDAVVVNSQQAATIVDESGTEPVTAAKLTQSQGSGSELIRVTMDSIKSYVDGSGDFDGDGEADVGQGVRTASEIFEELANVLAAVSIGLAEAVSTDMQGAVSDTSLSAEASKALIANVIQQTVGMALENRGLASVSSRVVQNVDAAIVNGDKTAFVDSAANRAPVAVDRTLALRTGKSKAAKLRGRDFDSGDTLTFALVDTPAGVTLGTGGEFTYDATGVSAGTYTFDFTVTDDATPPLSDTGTVKVTVLGGNLAPLAQDMEIAMRLGEAITLTFPARDFDGDALTFSFVANPSAIASVTGSQFTLDTSATGFSADAYSVTYLVDDGNGGTDTGNIVVDVLALNANNPPTAFNSLLEIKVGQTGSGMLRATDPDGQTLTYSDMSGDALGFSSITPSTGAYEFSAAGLSVGVYTVKFSVTDGTDTAEAMVRIIVTSVVAAGETANTAPIARNAVLSAETSTTGEGTLRGFDREGDALTYMIVADSGPSEGTATVDADGTFTYTALTTAGEFSFDYKVTDAPGASATGTVTLNVFSANRPPLGINSAIEIDRATVDSPYSGVFQAIDDGSSLTYIIESNAGDRAALTGAGGSDGSFTFTYAANDLGRYEIVFNVFDGTSYGLGKVMISIVDSSASNSAPVAVDGGMRVTQGTTGAGVLGAYDPDAGDTLTFAITSGSAELTSTGSSDGSFTFVAASNMAPGIYPVMFSVTDGGDLSDMGKVSVAVLAAAGVNNPPVAEDGEMQMSADEVKQGRFVASDADRGDRLTFSITDSGGLTAEVIGASTGRFSVDSTGAKGSYTITFSVSDGTDSDIGVVEVQVSVANSPPVAADTTLTLVSGATETGVVLGGSDPDGGDTLVYAKLTDPAQGAVTVDAAAGTYSYDATGVAAGIYSFTYSVTDNVVTKEGTVTITVTAANNPPTAQDGTLPVTTGESGTGVLGGGDLDGTGGLTYTVTVEPSQGDVSVTDTGPNYTFDASGVVPGVYTFTYRVSDGTDTATAEVTVTVNAVANNAPTAGEGMLKGLSGSSFDGVLVGKDNDEDTLTFEITDVSGEDATATVTDANTGAFTFDATDAADGTYTVTYTVSDSISEPVTGTVVVTVGSFLQVSGIKVNGVDHMIADFESNGASVTVPLLTFGFNLEAKGSVGTDMTVKIGLSMVDTNADIDVEDRRKIVVVVDAGEIMLMDNGELVMRVPAAAVAQIAYFNGSSTDIIDVTNAGEDLISTTPLEKATTLSLNVNSILSRINAEQQITDGAGGTLTSLLTNGVFSVVAVISVTDANGDAVMVRDNTDAELTMDTTITSDMDAGGMSVTGQSVSGVVTIAE